MPDFSMTRSTTRRCAQIALLLAAIAVIHAMEMRHLGYVPEIFFSSMLMVVLAFRFDRLLHFTLLFVTLVFYWRFAPKIYLGTPVIGMFFPLAASTLPMLAISRFRSYLDWWRRGEIDRSTWLWMAIAAVSATGALLLWAMWTDNLGIGATMAQSLSAFPRAVVFALIVPVFAASNALAEECFFRGVVQSALKDLFSVPVILLLQASVFASAHYAAGFPNGVVGYAMTFVYAAMLGYLRVRSKGLLAPVLTHFCADLTIGYFLL
jgi:membrane protease YdiL (CAAX protease family)